MKISEADPQDVRSSGQRSSMRSDLSFLCLPDDAAREVVPLLRTMCAFSTPARRTAPRARLGLRPARAARHPRGAENRDPASPCRAATPPALSPIAPLVELGIIPQGRAPERDEPDRLQRRRQKDDRRVRGRAHQQGAERPAPLRPGAAPQTPARDGRRHGLDTAPNFVPVVADYYAGMETMIPLDVTALGVSAPQVASALAGNITPVSRW